jgi:hypothetical protein
VAARYLPLALLALAAGVILSCEDKIVQHYPPVAPSGLQVAAVTNTTVTLRWTDRSSNEVGFIIYRQQGDAWARTDTAGVNQTSIEIGELQPGTTYRFRVTAYNQDGESEPTDEVQAQTTQPQMPNPPTDVAATPLSSSVVQVTWTDRGTQDSFLIQRREDQTAWTGVGATPDNTEEYLDSTVQAQTHYFYRVGAKNQNGTSWSLDSAEVTTPQPGAPASPESLQVTIDLGTGIMLQWVDRSDDETYFEIGRGDSPQALGVRDTVSAGVTTYTDSLGDTVGIYYYGVRAVNDYGHSDWAFSGAADYRYCSDGVIPLCLGNYWQYRVDSVGGTDFDLRRSVISVDFLTGADFYLVGEGPPAGPVTDTLEYLHNFTGEGCKVIGYPLPDPVVPELLYRYPPLPAGSHYVCQGDCVEVLTTSTTKIVNGETYENCVGYERYFSPTHRVQYFIKPHTIGIVLELDFRGTIGAPVLQCERGITSYYVQN